MKGELRWAVLTHKGVTGDGVLNLNGHDIAQGDSVKLKGGPLIWKVEHLGAAVTARKPTWTVAKKVN